jgi:dipeptidyl aminopeptidase/acylaminoacyl peptidase
MGVSNQQRFCAEDLENVCTVTALVGANSHPILVASVSQARLDDDVYDASLWRLSPESNSAPYRLTIDAFGATSPALDASGQRLAFLSSRKTSTKQIHVLALEGGESRVLTSTDHVLDAIHQWSPDGARLLVSAKVRWTGDLGGRVTEDDSKDSKRPHVVRFLPYKADGSGIVLGKRTHLFSVDVSTGTFTTLVGGDLEVDGAAWSPDGRRLAFLRSRDGQQRHRNDLWIADADGSGARQLTHDLASIKHLAWSPDGSRIALEAGREEGEAATQAWLVDIKEGALRRLGDDDFELAAGGTAQWHRDGRRLAVISLHHGLQYVSVLDTRGDGAQHRLGEGLVQVQKLTSCGDRLAVVVATMRKPDEVHALEWDGKDEERLTSFNRDWLRGKPRPRVSKRWFEVPDGDGGVERVEAWLLRPQGEGPFPVLLDLHGGPHSHVLVDLSAHFYWFLLVSRGWMVVAPNAVGSSGYGKAFRERLRAQWGKLDLPQLFAVLDALQNDGLADSRAACAGKSYGGFLSAWAIGHCDRFRAAVVSAPVANVESHAGTSDSGYYVTPWMMGGELAGNRERYGHLSPTTYCPRMKTPTLLLQGEEDQRCPLGQSEELFAGMVRCSDAPVEMVVYPGGSHGMAKSGKPSHRVDYHQRIVDWVVRHAGNAGNQSDS